MPDSTTRSAEPQSAQASPATTPVATGPQTRTDAGHDLPAQGTVLPQATVLAAVERRSFKWLERIRRFVRHPLTQLIVAIILIVTSVFEASETFVEDFYNFKLRASHGLMLVGIVQVLAAIPDLIEGLERYLETAEQHAAEKRAAEPLE